MKLPAFLLLAFIGWLQANAQGAASVSSLFRSMEAARHDTTRARLYFALSEHESLSDLDSIRMLAERAVSIADRQLPRARGAERTSYLTSKAGALNNIGYTLHQKGNQQQALRFFRQSLQLRQQLNDLPGVGESYSNIGQVHFVQGDMVRALLHFQQSLEVREKLGNKDDIAASLTKVALIYQKQEKHQAALEQHRKALALRKQTGDEVGIAVSLNNIGACYRSMGNTIMALRYYRQSEQQLRQLRDWRRIAIVLNNIGNMQEKQEQLSDALASYQESLSLYEKAQDQETYSASLRNISSIRFRQGKYPEALTFAQKALEAARACSSADRAKDAEQALSEVYEKLGRPQEAFNHFRKYILLRDSIRSDEAEKAVLEQQFQNAYRQQEVRFRAEQEKRNALAVKEAEKQRVIRNAIIGGALVMLVLFGVLWNRYRMVQRTRRVIELEKQRSEALLLNILPVETAEELKKYGETLAHQHELVTVLFADIQNFTKVAESLSPREVVGTLHEYFQGFDEIVEKHGLEKIKTIGDAYLCVGGLSKTVTVSPAQVVEAALDMQKLAQRMMVQRSREGLPWFELRMGIHSGPVVAGVVGIKKFAYDIWGDTVNTAACLQQYGVPGRINISGDTFELVKEKFVCSFRGWIKTKDHGELEMYFVDRERMESELLLAEAEA